MFLLQHLNRILQRLYSQPASEASDLPEYVAPPPTTENLEWADLAIIDFSQANTPAGRQELAKQICQAMKTHGFFYIVNHGYTTEKTKRIFSIANATFDLVGAEEKRQLAGQSEEVYEGYKPRRTWQIEQGVADQIEHYNSELELARICVQLMNLLYQVNRSVRKREHPTVLKPHLDEIQAFAEHNHNHILFNILRIMAIGMDLPEETFVEKHRFEAPGESSDIGSITILWSQPISGLQILSPDGIWRYIRHIENALVVNTGDVMKLLSGGFYKPTIHRVVQPPIDQAKLERLGVFYFAMAADDIKLASVGGGGDNETVAPTMGDWRKQRTGKYGKGTMKQSQTDGQVEEEVILGVTVKEYN
ncbi:hypothetical protein VNI00_008535 [Paramarasmius palmivorus]|uniref:Clavaminate synthase-like protein n=1 Tax=Paramarasmius palmivorus TaxID=297713 RepID=A0AAW0CW95_9AGAR